MKTLSDQDFRKTVLDLVSVTGDDAEALDLLVAGEMTIREISKFMASPRVTAILLDEADPSTGRRVRIIKG